MNLLIKSINSGDLFDNTLPELASISPNNAWGLLLSLNTETHEFMPIICRCGGSHYLCRKHAKEMWDEQQRRLEPVQPSQT